MNRTLKLIFWMSLTAVLTACPTRKVERRPHDGPVSESTPVSMPTVQASSSHFEQAPLEKALEALKRNGADLYREVIVPLSAYVMNKNYVEDPQYTGTLKLRAMLNAYNRALFSLIESGNEVVSKERLLDRYQNILLSGCDAEMTDLQGCVNIRFFRIDPWTAKIVQRIAKNAANVRHYYKLLALAYELQNRTKDSELEFLYLKRAREYAHDFHKMSDADKQKPLMRRHGIIFETILQDFIADPKSAEFRQFVFEFEPWTYSRLESNAFRYGAQKLFQLVSENYMYENGKLNADLIQSMRQAQAKEDVLGPSFTMMVKDLSTGLYGSVLKSLGVDYTSIINGTILDEYFFVTDRLYRGHISVDEAVQIWRGSQRNSKRLLDSMSLYMRVQIVKKIIETNEFMREIYAHPEYDTTTMIRTVLEKSKEISDGWLDMLERFGQLKLLANSQLKAFGRESDDLAKINLLFSSTRRNIKYMAVYPNMFLMSYFLAKNRASIEVATAYRTLKLDHTTMINSFMNGQMAPWFNFGNDDSPLSKIEMMYAYYFALNNGSFETFNQIKDSNGNPAIDRVSFLKEIIKEYLGAENQKIREAFQENRTYFTTNGYSQFLQYCQRLKAGDVNFAFEMDFKDIGLYTYIGGGTEKHWSPLGRAPYTFYKEVNKPSSPGKIDLSTINNQVRFKLTVVRTMIGILKDDLEKRGVSKEETEKWTNEIQGLAEETEKNRLDFINQTISKHREIGDCVEVSRDLEFSRQQSLYRQEIAHLKSVYRDMMSMRGLAGPALATKQLERNRHYGFTADQTVSIDPTNPAVTEIFKHDVITQSYYRYSQYDLFVRMMNRMKDLRPSTFFRIPSDLNLSIDFFRDKRGQPISFLNSQGVPVSEDEFVKNGMRFLSGLSDGGYINWAKETAGNEFYNEHKVKALLQLHQITYGNAEFPNQVGPDDIISEVLNMVKLASIKPEEVEVLQYLGRDRKVSIADLNRFMADPKTGEHLPLLETIFKLLIKNEVPLGEAESFYLAMKHAGYFLFSPSEKVMSLMRTQYQPLVDGVRMRSKDFLAAADARAKTLTVDDLSFVYELDENRIIKYSAGTGPSGAPELISERSVKEMQAAERDFDRKTENYFKGNQ